MNPGSSHPAFCWLTLPLLPSSLQPILWAIFLLVALYYIAWFIAEAYGIKMFVDHRSDDPPV
jgi:hypothetical protein